MGKFKRAFVSAAIVTSLFVSAAAGCAKKITEEEAYSPIESVLALGKVDLDGAKVAGLALEYGRDMSGVSISDDTYRLNVYDSKDNVCFGEGEIGDIVKWYISDKPEMSESAVQGAGSGEYVILELFTDYLSSSEYDIYSSMLVKVTQVKDITLPDGEVIPAGNTDTNNAQIISTVNEITGNVTTVNRIKRDGFYLPEIEGFEFYTDEDPNGLGVDGPAFVWENCFDQQDGLYHDIHLSYALYVPDNYEELKENGNWAMVVVDNPAADATMHPLKAILTTRTPTYFATAGQQAIKDAHPEAGIDGLFVVVPVITARVNDNGGTPAEYEALVHLWDSIIDDYGINGDYIYGVGQSVGGMVLMETQRNRDNFFAGLLLYEDQWAQNYYVDTLFARGIAHNENTANGANMHYPRTDDYISYNYYYDGYEKVYEDYDPYNYYYTVSDDNFLVLRVDSNDMCIDSWREMDYLYRDLTGENNGLNSFEITVGSEKSRDDLASQNAELEAFLNAEKSSTRNINTVTFVNGSNGYTCRKYDATYEWLLSQSRDSEMTRSKLDINKPFAAADEQIQTQDRALGFTSEEGETLYYITGAFGAGTRFYNSTWYSPSYGTVDAVPGWLPEGMGSWTTVENGVTVGSGYTVEEAQIVSATVIDGGAALAIEYSKDMSNLYVNLEGDPILKYGSTDEYRTDIAITVAPFSFYDAEGNEIACKITNVYVNSVAERDASLKKGEGSGCYVIVEFETAISAPKYVVQRTTLHTGKYIASALPWKFELSA